MNSIKKPVSRRDLLRFSALGAGALATLGIAGPVRAARLQGQRPSSDPRHALVSCNGKPTPAQTKGPFYPIHDQLDKDNDLTIVNGAPAHASGQMIYVMGTVKDINCSPIQGVLVEIWQACESGRYNHAHDPNPAPLDPHFQYFGKAITDAHGRYIFKTIIPGAYPASENWIRPPHIHYRVLKRGYFELITQMYFAGQALNTQDRILNALPPAERDSVVVEFTAPTSNDFEPESKIGVFDIVLRQP